MVERMLSHISEDDNKLQLDTNLSSFPDEVESDTITDTLTDSFDRHFREERYVEDIAIRAEMERVLLEQIDELTNNEYNTLMLYYGLFRQSSHSFREIADLLGLTQQRISIIHKKALRRLRLVRRSNKLRDFLY